ncbi:hypothetical protein MMC34_004949 [Xylographa carneopallida]|nr:hypothetical protein [Xylographa carneopallida]
MLRLPTTRIDLGPRDLAWHIDRYRQRKAQYEESRHVSGTARSAPQASQLQSSRVPFRCLPHQQVHVPPATGVGVVDDALVSSEPVPRDSRAFWNGVLAVAGTSIQNAEPLPHERYTDEAAASSSESQHTSIPSDPSSGFDEQELLQLRFDHGRYSHEQEFAQQGLGHAQNTHDLRDVVEASTRLSELRSRFSADSSQSSSNGKEDATNDFIDLEAGRGALPARRRAFFNFRRAEHDGGIDEDISRLSRSFSSQLDFHASAHKPMPAHDDPEGSPDLSTARAVPLSRPAPRPVLQHRTSRLRGHGSQLEDEDAELAETIASLHELIDGAASPAPRLPPRLEHVRSRSGTVTRSPLYLSQAAASSSPEKPGAASPYHTHLQPGSTTSLLSLPPRRAKQYRPQSSSSLGTQASRESDDVRGPAGLAGSTYQSAHPQWEEVHGLQNGTASGEGHLAHSPSPQSRTHTISSSPPAPTQRPSPHLPPLPPPFSSTRRLLSFNLALPSSSPPHPSPPHPSPLPPHPYLYPPTSPTHPASRSTTSLPPHHRTPSPSPPETPPRAARMRVYNDALPAATQPQTPLGLPRHGVYTGAYTAPVRGPEARGFEARGHGSRAVAASQASPWRADGAAPTPTRLSWRSGGVGPGSGQGRGRGWEARDEQENGGAFVEAERRLRGRAGERGLGWGRGRGEIGE